MWCILGGMAQEPGAMGGSDGVTGAGPSGGRSRYLAGRW